MKNENDADENGINETPDNHQLVIYGCDDTWTFRYNIL
jgi:hypothetical protein